MINRDDMLELTRRMTVSRTSFTRIAGGYLDTEGFLDGTFNINFLNLSPKEKQNNLAIAKAIPFSNTNVNLKAHPFTEQNKSMWQLLQGIKDCGLKNDALMYTFYEIIGETYQTNQEYAIYLFHDRYDIPIKASDKERLGDSEEVYDYLICAICPLVGEYEPGTPEWGFLYPMFQDRSSDAYHIGIFNQNEKTPHKELETLFL